jgi:hypothetical protein
LQGFNLQKVILVSFGNMEKNVWSIDENRL